MPHRAALYTVRVHPPYRSKPHQLLRFGDFDGAGGYLGDAILRFLNDGIDIANGDGTRSASCEAARISGEDLLATFVHGQSGVGADIVDANNQLRIRQMPDDSQLVRCGSVFRLPPGEQLGWWAVHVNNGKNVKGLMDGELMRLVRENFDLMLEVHPFIVRAALEEAVDGDHIETIKLVRFLKPHDRATSETSRWVEEDADAKLEVMFRKMGERGLLGALVGRYLRGDAGAFDEIVEFRGLRFDEAHVTIMLDDGGTKTFNIDRPEGGHPLTTDLEHLVFDQGEPTPDSLHAELRRALNEMTS